MDKVRSVRVFFQIEILVEEFHKNIKLRLCQYVRSEWPEIYNCQT